MIKPVIGVVFGLAALATTGACQSQMNIVPKSIPMLVDAGDAMTIEVQVADQTGFAVLDTAATYAMVDDSLLTQSNAQPRNQDVMILGVAGQQLYPTIDVGPVVFGDVDIDQLPAAVNEANRFPGHKTILPLSSLSTRVVDFNFFESRIDLYDSKPVSIRNTVRSKLDYQDIQGLLFIPVRINGRSGLALVDTGSSVTYINRAFADLAKVAVRERDVGRIEGTDVSRRRVNEVNIRKMKIGDHTMSNFTIFASDPPLFEYLGLTDQPIMVLGLNTLRRFRVQIDRERENIVLVRPLNDEVRKDVTRGFKMREGSTIKQ